MRLILTIRGRFEHGPASSIKLKSTTISVRFERPFVPSRDFNPHRLMFKYERLLKSYPRSRNENNMLPSKFKTRKLGIKYGSL